MPQKLTITGFLLFCAAICTDDMPGKLAVALVSIGFILCVVGMAWEVAAGVYRWARGL